MLFTFHVSSADKSYVTQKQAPNWAGARDALIGSVPFREFTKVTMPSSVDAPIRFEEIFLMIPMNGLKNAWVMQGGRAGEYFTAVIVRTDDSDAMEDA